jgi:hypothetical protein
MIPPLIKSCERSPRFWTDLVFVTDAEIQRDGETFRTPYGCASESYDIQWSLPAGFKIRLQLGAELNAELFLATPSGSSLTLGWDDQAHWHPHVLRRNELERICRAIALTSPSDSDAMHPGWPIRLLDRFAPVCDADDITVAYATLFAAHREQSGLDDQMIAQITRRSDCRGNGFTWEQKGELGWVIDQSDNNGNRSLYSIRQPSVIRSLEQQKAIDDLRKQGVFGPEHHFPFAEWDACMATIDGALEQLRVIADQAEDAKIFAESRDDDSRRRFIQSVKSVGFDDLSTMASHQEATAAWIAEEALGDELGSLVVKCTEPFSIPTVRSYSVHYAVPDQPRGSESPLFSKLFVGGLNAMLRDLRVGSADHMSSGSKKTADGKSVSTGHSDVIQTTLTESELVDIIRRWFVFGGGPFAGKDGAPRPMLTRKLFSDPLDDDLHQVPTDSLLFNLIRLKTLQWSWGFALRRMVTDDGTRNEVAKELTDAGFSVAFRSGDDEGDGITVRIESIDTDSSTILWDVMRQHELLLLPNLIAASRTVAEQVEEHPERVIIVESPAELAESLRATTR